MFRCLEVLFVYVKYNVFTYLVQLQALYPFKNIILKLYLQSKNGATSA